MRIIAGEYRGRRLQAPKGDATRPTTDRVRESLMSALSSARGGFEGAVVLDAFAGSGALGLEALLRGAASAHFFEKDGVALRALCANVEALGVPTLGAGARARLHRADVLERPPVWARPPFDLVLLDPPYALPAESALSMVAVLAGAGRLRPRPSCPTSTPRRQTARRTPQPPHAGCPLRRAASTGILSWIC